jgi:PAS domain S-box-containing protein
MKSKISYEEIEKDIADLNGALKTLKKSASVEKVLNNIIANVRFQIDELRSREEELEKSRAYFQRFFNASPTPLTLIGLDGKRMDCNPAMERLTGRRKKELVGVPVEATYAKEEQPKVRKKLVDETIKKGYMYGFKTYFERPDGTRLPVVANCSLLRNEKGKPLFIIYSATSVLKLQRQEEKLKSSQEYMRFLLYSIPNPTSILDLSGKRIDTAKATEDLFRLPRKDMLGTKVKDLYAKEDLRKIKETMERGKEGYSSCEATCIRGDGTKFPAILSFAPVKDKRGNLINIAFSATDITRFRKREGELRKRQQEQANAVSSLSKVLSKTVQGDLSARVDTKGWSEELAAIGMAINTLIENLEFEKKEKS